jgi:hypothetical protein
MNGKGINYLRQLNTDGADIWHYKAHTDCNNLGLAVRAKFWLLGDRTLRANKRETFDWLKFTLEGVGERTHGYAFEDTAF